MCVTIDYCPREGSASLFFFFVKNPAAVSCQSFATMSPRLSFPSGLLPRLSHQIPALGPCVAAVWIPLILSD